MADDQKKSPDDKSINELLKEYAGDVKDKDLDDFLKNSDDEDDAFEAATSDDDDDDDTDEDDQEEVVSLSEPRRHAAGLVTMLLIVVAFGAAGAGAYVFLNRDEGMTSIMGGFAGNNDEPALPTPPAIDTTATATPAPGEMPTPMPDAPAQPTPITNADAAAATTPPATLDALPTPIPSSPDSAPTPSPAAPAGADIVAPATLAPTPPPADVTAATATPTPAPVTPTPPAPQTPAPVTAATAPTPLAPTLETAPAPAASTPAQVLPPAGETPAASAVDAWTSGATPTPPANTDAKAALPEKPVAEVKAKAVPAPKQKTKEPLISSASKTKAETKSDSKYLTMNDGALTPPYVAIQAKKNAGASATTSTATASTAATPKMAPVLEGGSANRDTDGNTNKNVGDVTKATGDTAAMVASGGGKIEMPGIPSTSLSGNTAPMPSAMMKSAPASSNAEPELRSIPLAINGGRSAPDDGRTQTRAYAQIPDTDMGTKPASAPEVTSTPRAPVEDAKTVEPVRAVPPAPVEDTPRASASSSSSSDTGKSAPAIVVQAQAAEKSGDKEGALSLYQKALEVDAVYGDGKSIDRGAVYDRIGAIRAGR